MINGNRQLSGDTLDSINSLSGEEVRQILSMSLVRKAAELRQEVIRCSKCGDKCTFADPAYLVEVALKTFESKSESN
jgi:hypothetical protein